MGLNIYIELSRALNSRPTYLFFTVTSRCNAFCDFCWNWKNVVDAGKFAKPQGPITRAELSLDEIEKITKNLPPMLVVNLFGGEPFLRDDLFEIISLFAINCKTKYISIPTNAFLTEKILSDISRSLIEFPNVFFKIYISLDGPPEIHNAVRKSKDGYQNLMKTVEGLIPLREKYSNLSISCNINYNAKTQDRMEKFLEEVISWKYFDSLSLDLIRGEPYNPDYLVVDVEKFKRLQLQLTSYQRTSAQPFSPLHKAIEQKTQSTIAKSLLRPDERVFNCFAGKKILLLNDIGDVHPCEPLLETNMGNLRDFEYNLELLLNSDRAKKIRQSIVNKECNCRWECAMNTANIFDLKNYPELLIKTILNITN